MKALLKLIEPRNETTLEELIAELGYSIHVKTRIRPESVFEAQRA